MNGSNLLGGVFAGYNWQQNPFFVAGLEADIEATGLNVHTGSFTTFDPFAGVPLGSVVTGVADTRVRLPWQGSLRTRFGYAMGPALFYATGGLAFAQMDTQYSWIGLNIPGDSFSTVHAGWTLGGGVEYALTANWSARAEYRYSAFAFTEPLLNSPLGGSPALPAGHNFTESAVRFGVAYKFGGS